MRDEEEQAPFSIGSAVRFAHNGRTVHGHLLQRQGRCRFAKVVDAEERTWRVPEAMLEASGRAPRTTMVTRHDEARAAWRVGDEVTFAGPAEPMRGEIVKLNPQRARVRSGKTLWNVPYGLLRGTGAESARNGVERLNAIAAMARRLMDEHGLADWTLAFVEAGRRLGDCNYRDRVIRIGRAHALDDGEEQIRDTVLHEIAHAITGPKAGHGPLWKATARRIGATPKARAYETQAGRDGVAAHPEHGPRLPGPALKRSRRPLTS